MEVIILEDIFIINTNYQNSQEELLKDLLNKIKLKNKKIRTQLLVVKNNEI